MAFQPKLGKKVGDTPTSSSTNPFVPSLGRKVEEAEKTPSVQSAPSTDQGIFTRFANQSKKALQFASDVFVSPVAREIERPFVSMYRGATGTKGPVKTPFGDVKPYTELSTGEAAMGAFDAASTVVPVEKVVAPILRPIAKAASKLVPDATKTLARGAQVMANISPEKTKILQESPSLVRSAQETLQAGESALPAVGEEVYKAAQTAYKGAMDAWSGAQKNLLDMFGNKLDDASNAVRSRVAGVFGEEGIRLTDKGVDLTGTRLIKN